MAQKPQRPNPQGSDVSPVGRRSGAGQAVVELEHAERGGLVFWSRQHFEIGSELQIRMKRENLPTEFALGSSPTDDNWVSIHGFVVACRAVRRTDGSHGFRVSLLLDPLEMAPDYPDRTSCSERMPLQPGADDLGVRIGLN
jgi:hypothetical protein